MFTPETIIDTVETAKLNAIEKIQMNKNLKENVKAAIRAEANFAKTIAATSKNIADEFAHFKYEEVAKTYNTYLTNFFDTVTKTYTK